MTPSPVRVLAVVVVLVGFVATPLAAAGEPSSPAVTNGTAAASDPASGAHLAGVVAVQDSGVRGTVADETFQARLANATSDRERAALIDERLNATERRLAALEAQLRALERGRENGSLDAGAYTARLAGLGASADRLAEGTDAIARAAERLPAERREALNVGDRIEDIRTRARAVSERASAARDAVDGVGDEVRAAPVSLADIEAIADRVVRVPESLRGIAGSERINIHVLRANGTTAVFAVNTAEGRVVSVTDDAFENPTLIVYTDYRVVKEIQRAEDSAAAVRAAVENDRIRYDGQGLGNSLKYGAIRLVSLLAGGLLWLLPLVRP